MASMASVVARRALTLVVVVVAAPSLTFLIWSLLRDGDSLSEAASGLAHYLYATLVHADLGAASVNGAVMPVRRVLIEGLPVDLGLVFGGLAIGVGVGVAGGLLCGPLTGARREHVFGVGSALGLSLPVWALGYMVLFGFGRIQGGHPLFFVADTGDYAQPWVDPLVYLRAIGTASAVIAIPLAAASFRMTRVSLRETRDLQILTTARAKGVDEGRVLRRHALPSAAPGIVTLAGVSLPWLVFNAIMIEIPYNLPGGFRMAHFGQFLIDTGLPSVITRSALPQRTALDGVVLEAAAIIAFGMLVCDALNAWLDPRLRD